MFERARISGFGDFERPLSRREPAGVYAARLCGWSEAAKAGLWRFHELARQRGVIVDGRLPNPDGGQLEHLRESLGDAFEPTAAFAERALERWMPRMDAPRRRDFAAALEVIYGELARQGKPVSVQKNVYAKLMCWLYYRFERLTPLLGGDEPPKVLYASEGISAHEWMMLRALAAMGADVLIVQTAGDAAYLKLDPDSRFAQLLDLGDGPFPEGFSLKVLRGEMERPAPAPPKPAPAPAKPAHGAIVPEAYFKAPAKSVCVNAWMAEPDYRQILTPPERRGGDPALICTALVRLTGARDGAGYAADLLDFYRKLQDMGRTALVVDGPMPAPTPEEVARIRRRGRYNSPEEMIVDLATNLPDAKGELLYMTQLAFVKAMRREVKTHDSLRKLEAAAVGLLCRARRYFDALFGGWREGQVSVFILMNGCANPGDALFVRWLSMLPTDVLLLAPNLEAPCAFEDAALLDIRGETSLPAMKFPRDEAALRVRTLAADAEADMDRLLYSDSGMYRSRQFGRANAVTLRTTFDELFILWDQELRYRQGFSADGGTAVMPVLFAKVCGVPGGDMRAYWQRVKRLAGNDALYYDRLPIVPPGGGAFQALALKAVRNGRLDRRALTEDRRYPFGLLRPEVQAHMLDKLQLMLERRLIRGTFENGAEYTVVATVLGLGAEVTRRLQAFDFTRRNPKLVCVSAGEDGATLEDAILMTFLNLTGFDVALFVPTGYRSVERFMADNLPVEHQAGPYVYDRAVPDLNALPGEKGPTWLGRLFGRGE